VHYLKDEDQNGGYEYQDIVLVPNGLEVLELLHYHLANLKRANRENCQKRVYRANDDARSVIVFSVCIFVEIHEG